ncbi:putative ribonuclease H-like domain-containing protein [Tanacetum coccineum]
MLMRPFRCPVTILNTIDHLGKFDGKADEGFFVGYSINSKAFRVFNSRTRIVEENLHVQFSETACDDASKARMESVLGKYYIMLPLWPADLPFSQNLKSSPDVGFKHSGDNEKKVTEELGGDPSNKNDSVNKTNNINTASDGKNTNNVNTDSSTANTAGIEVNTVSSNTSIKLPNDPNMPKLEDIVYSDDYEDVDAEADMNNLNTFMPISPIPTTRIHKYHLVEQIIGDMNLAPQTRRMTKNLEEHGLFSSGFKLDIGYAGRASTIQDAELAAAVQAAVDAMLPQIREQVREEYRNVLWLSGNPPPVTIPTWLEPLNKQKPRTFEKAVTPVMLRTGTLTWKDLMMIMDYFKELFFLQFFPRAEQERLKREYHSLRQKGSEKQNSGAGRDQRNRGQQSHRSNQLQMFLLFMISQLFPEFQDVFPEELPGIPPIRDVESTLSTFPGVHDQSPSSLTHGFRIGFERVEDQIARVVGSEICINRDGFLTTGLTLDKLMRKGEKFVWNTIREKALKKLSTLGVYSAAWESGWPYASRQLKPYEVNYPTHDLELAAVYHPGKANMVADRLSRKSGMIAGIKVEEEIIRDLERLDIELCVRGQNSFWASLRIEPNLISQIKAAQKDDGEIWAIIQNLDKQTEFHVDSDGILWQGTKLCVPEDPALREVLMTEAHSSPFSIHPGSTKMYHDLKQHFWVNAGLRGSTTATGCRGRLTKTAHFLPIPSPTERWRNQAQVQYGFSSSDRRADRTFSSRIKTDGMQVQCAPFEMLYGRKFRATYLLESRWGVTNKKDERGIVIKNKARLVTQRYTQEEGINYDEVFAPIARNKEIRLFLAYASYKDFVVYQMDVKSAFLYGKIEEEVYVCQPLGFEDPDFPDRLYKVEKALYGLHQAPRAWYETLSTYLLDNRFQRGKIDKTLFIRRDKGDILLVQVYVDDIIFGSTKKSLCTEFEKMMHKKFQMSSMGELTFFLGLQVKQKEDGIFISQDKYVTKILKKFGFTDVKTASTPMETKKALLKDKDGEEVDVHLYRSMIGSLMYLTSSRPDIMFAVCACARYQVNPKVSHLHVVKRIFRYLKGQPKLGLWYIKDSPFDLVAYTDSDYARASLDKKFTTRGKDIKGKKRKNEQKPTRNEETSTRERFEANIESRIKTVCRKQIVVANSITEAEYVAASSCYRQGTAMKKKLIHMVNNHTDKNVADLLTKAFDVSSEGIEKIVDFSNANPIRYALTINPTIYTSCIKQFWATVKAKTVNGEVQLQDLVDGKMIIITKSIVRRDLQLEDAKGIDCLPNATIFEQLTLMGAKTTAWNEFSSTMASAIICFSYKNQKCNLSKYIYVKRNGENLENGSDEAVNEEMDDNLERAAAIATSLDAKQDKGDTIAQTRLRTVSKLPLDPLLARGNTLRSGEDRLKLEELMEFCTKLQQRVLDLENTKTAQAQEITSLKLRVKKLEKKGGSRNHKLKILYKDMDEKEINVAEKEVSTADPVTTAGEVVTTASPTETTTADDLTLAQTLIEIRNAKSKVKGVVLGEQSESTTRTRPQQLPSKDKGKGIMEDPEKPTKKKDQIRHDEEVAQRLQAQMQAELEEEDGLVRQREEEATLFHGINVKAMIRC